MRSRVSELIFVLLVPLLFSACEKAPASKPAADQTAFQKPTATEVFNLRTRCAELGDKILQRNPVDTRFTKEQTSHYDVNTNRCYVDLFVSNGFVRNNDYGNTKWPDYASETVFDGQSRETLAFVVHDQGKVTAFMTDGPPDPSDAEAYKKIKALMGDDRKQ